MRTHATASPPGTSTPLTSHNGILVVSGYGVRVSVKRGHLHVADGFAGERREARLARATCRLKRLVVLGHTGVVSLEALRWLADVGAAFVQIDMDGNVVSCFAPRRLDDARLRRAQALASFSDAGLSIACDLLRLKLEGQLRVLERLPRADEAQSAIVQARDAISDARSIDRLRLLEAAGAGAYWNAWAYVLVQFARQDAAKVPDHWRVFGSRTSPLTASPRRAANPANAILNYLYAILEAEARVAALTMGLDPGMGVAHADQRARDSLALDLMEPVRPEVDALVLALLHERTFSAQEFFETRSGVCRLVPPLPQLLAETAQRWASIVAPLAERIAQRLLSRLADRPTEGPCSSMVPNSPKTLPTLLTQANRSAGRDAVRIRPKRKTAPRASDLPQACRICGRLLSDNHLKYCAACLPERRAEVLTTFVESGPQSLARLRAQDCDPAHGGGAARKRGASNSRRQREVAEWNTTHAANLDPERFRQEILPALQGVPLSVMTRATGLSRRYCWMIRGGMYVPHPKHWDRLLRLGGGGRISRDEAAEGRTSSVAEIQGGLLDTGWV